MKKIILFSFMLVFSTICFSQSKEKLELNSKTNKVKRFSFTLSAGLGARVPMSDSYYNLWKDLAIGDAKISVSDYGLKGYISGNWSDYFFTSLRTDFDFLISKNLSIGFSAYPDKYKKTFTEDGETDNWTGDGSNGLEDHWELKRKLRIATYNFGPNIKFRIPFNDRELSLSYLYGLSYLWRSSYELSYYNQLTGSGEKGFLGLRFVSDGNLTKLRYTGSNSFHKIELGITGLESKEGNGSVTLKIGYQFLKMDNIRYKVLKYNKEYYYEATGYFHTGEFKEYQVGDSDNIYIDNNKFNLDLSCFYITLLYSWHW